MIGIKGKKFDDNALLVLFYLFYIFLSYRLTFHRVRHEVIIFFVPPNITALRVFFGQLPKKGYINV